MLNLYLATYYWFKLILLAGQTKFHSPKEVMLIGDGHRLQAQFDRPLAQLFDSNRAFQEGIGGMYPKWRVSFCHVLP